MMETGRPIWPFIRSQPVTGSSNTRRADMGLRAWVVLEESL